MRITSGGSVGVGTITPTGKLEIASFANTYAAAPAITFTDTSGNGSSNRWIVGNIATTYGTFNIASAPNASSTTYTPRLSILSNGNVGIGTTTPEQKLHVEGTIQLGNQENLAWAYDNGSYYNYITNTYDTSNGIIYRSGSWTSNTNMICHSFETHASSTWQKRLVINQNGNIGIGNVSPSQKVHIDGQRGQPGTSGTTQNGLFRLQGGSGVGYGETMDMGFHVGVEGPASYGWIQSTNTSDLSINYRLCLNPNGGNVGIGTASPSSKLTVSGTSANTESAQIRIINPGANEQTLHIGYNTTSDYVYLNAYRAGLGYKLISLNPDGGNVAIGFTSTSYKFDVNGTARVTSLITGSGGIKISGGSAYSSYTPDGVFNAAATPNFIASTGNGDIRFGYQDNGSGLYSTAMGYYVKSTDGAGVPNRVVGAFIIRDQDKGTTPFIVYNNGSLVSEGHITASGDITAYSDASVKENIRPIANSLDRIMKSRGVLYDRIDTKTKDNIGFIAQELEEQFPELVTTNENGTKAVKYQNATAILFEAVKELAHKNKEQQYEIDTLKGQIPQILNVTLKR